MTSTLAGFGNIVPDGYAYTEKLVVPGPLLQLAQAQLKWYALHPPETPIAPEQDAEARAYVAAEAQRLQLDRELGFVILHRAGTALLLLLTTWRNTNELWESVYAKEAGGQQGYRLIEFATSHRGTYCVWELGPIWHERHAWVRFIGSQRDEAAKQAYLADHFSGPV